MIEFTCEIVFGVHYKKINLSSSLLSTTNLIISPNSIISFMGWIGFGNSSWEKKVRVVHYQLSTNLIVFPNFWIIFVITKIFTIIISFFPIEIWFSTFYFSRLCPDLNIPDMFVLVRLESQLQFTTNFNDILYWTTVNKISNPWNDNVSLICLDKWGKTRS